MASIRPLHRDFLFTFLNETRDGLFVNKHSSIIIVTPEVASQGTYARWARVYAVGDEIKDFKAGDIVCIQPSKWTLSINWEGQKLWKSDDEWVLAVANDPTDESLAITY
jgi:hypothetical protein